MIATQVVLDVFCALLLCTRKTLMQREIKRKGAGWAKLDCDLVFLQRPRHEEGSYCKRSSSN